MNLISKYIGPHGRHVIEIEESTNEFHQLLFEHCAEAVYCGRGVALITDSQRGRLLIKEMLKAHGVNEVNFISQPPNNNWHPQRFN